MVRIENWGVVGWADEYGALADDSNGDISVVGGYGFERILDPGVIYRDQPDIPGIAKWVEKPGSKGRIFQMGWPTPEPPATLSLLDLHASIASRRKELVANDVQLAALDEAIGGLIGIAGRLHANGATLGFLQPGSVRIGTNHDGSTFTLLPDVGFAWDDTGGLYEPEWLANPKAEVLFDRGARARNAEYVARLKRPADERDLRSRAKESNREEAEDVRTVARLIAVSLAGLEEVRRWCGPSKTLLRLPGKDVAPDTAAPIWDDLIAPALEGRIETFHELGLRLGVAKASGHFLYSPPAPPWKGWRVMRRVALVAVALCVLASLWATREWLFPAQMPAPYCKMVQEKDPLHAKLFALKDLEARARVDEAVRADFGRLLHECREEHASLPHCKHDCLKQAADTYLDVRLAEGEAVLARLGAMPRAVNAERAEITRAIAGIGLAAREAKRDATSGVVKRLERQLAVRGGGVVETPRRSEAEAER
jgi:hypothetical protein